jgi:hypothetical protein
MPTLTSKSYTEVSARFGNGLHKSNLLFLRLRSTVPGLGEIGDCRAIF